MDRFQAMQVFVRVVDANSFSRAADSLGLPRATVTNIIQNLERLLQVRLLNRSTRRLSLTQDGAAYYERCVGILADVEDAESAFREASQQPRGRLRIDLPASLGRLVLIPRLSDFHSRYPEVELAIGLSDRPVDMVREAVDCAIRVGKLPDSSLVARRIGTFFFITCASPSYLERLGEPRTLAELAKHHAVNYFSSLTGRTVDFDFVVDGQAVEVRMNGTVSVNEADAYLACALQGLGLVQVPRFMALPYLEAGTLREVLPAWSPTPMPVSVVYPANRHLSPKVRAFADWVAEHFAACPLLGGRTAVDHCCSYEGKAGDNTMRALVDRQNLAESAF